MSVSQMSDSAPSFRSLENFTYPSPPDQLKLFTKHRLVNRPKTTAVVYLEHMLTKTSLTTQKATHTDIEKLGASIHEKQVQKYELEKEYAVVNAVRKTQELAKREQERVLSQALRKADMEKADALAKQKSYYVQLAQRTKRNRDVLEEEKVMQVVRKKDTERKHALKEQWDVAERLKREAIERVLTEQHKKLRAEAALEREKSIARALRVAKERFAIRMEEQVDRAREECMEIAAENAAKEQKLHEIEIQRLNERIAVLTMETKQQLAKQKHAQKEFVNMETDYSRFLDFTTPVSCHSDYLISPRKSEHGIERSRHDRNIQTNLIALNQKSISIQTDVQIIARR